MLKPEEIQAGKWYLVREPGYSAQIVQVAKTLSRKQLEVWITGSEIEGRLEDFIWLKELDLKKLETME